MVFVPFSEVLIERLGLGIGDLVPFQLEYQRLHLNDRNDLSEVSSPIEETNQQTVDLHH